MPSYLPDFRQHRLKQVSTSAWAQVVATKLFCQLDLTILECSITPFDFGLGGETFTTF